MTVTEYPLISVILPTFNRRHLVERAILSVIYQTYPNWELLIIDDGSTDGSWVYLLSKILEWKRQVQSFGRLEKTIQIHQTEHRGVSSARNFGIQIARGEWISFIDSDDEWYPEKLKKQIQFHQKHTNIYFSQTNEVWNKKGNLLEPKGKYKKKSGHFLQESLALCMVTCSSFFAKKESLATIGMFREEMKTCEDYDLWNRILLSGFSIGLIEENLLTRYGGHHDQLSNQFQGIERFRLYSLLCIWNEIIGEHETDRVPKGTNANLALTSFNDRNFLSLSIQFRLSTLIQGREKRGKNLQFLQQIKDLFLTNQSIPKKDLLTLLDDSLF